ncbi:MAG: ABC transporter permease [Lachnospiraceae bacterium]|nr:ABC transporter permease [Lachnospiraceae bacterium]
MLMGFLTGRSNCCRKLLDPMLQAVRAIPGIGFLPISIVWFGVGEKNTLFLITLAAFFPIYLNTQEGISNVPTEYIRSGQMLGAKGISLFATVIFPAAFPQIFVGLRLGLGVAWAYLVLGEMTGVSQGIGAVMMNGRMLGNVELVMTGMIVIAVMGKLADCILLHLYRLFYEKGSKNDGR